VISFQFVADNFDELEADFQREYGIDLREALYGEDRIGGRRLTALINGLSLDSATMRKVNSGGDEWGNTEELLATLIEIIDLSNRMFFQANFEGSVWEPVQVPRPRTGRRSTKQEEQEELSPTEALRAFTGTMAMSLENVVVDAFPEDVAISSTPEEPE